MDISEFQSRWNSNAPELIEKVLGQPPELLRRINAGLQSEVYSFSTGVKDFVLKIRQRGLDVKTEQKILERCRGKIPVPKVIFAGNVMGKDILIMEKVLGRPFSEGLKDLNLKHKKAILKNAGEILGKIHSIDPSGFNLASWNKEKKHVKGEFPSQKLVLCHGDFRPRHIFIDDYGKITGIIDFGGAVLFPREFDIAPINYQKEEIEISLLLKGYPFPIDKKNWNFFAYLIRRKWHSSTKKWATKAQRS